MEVDYSRLDAKTEQLRQKEHALRRRSNAIVQNFYEKLDLSWIYHDNALEGVVLSYSELRAAIDTKIISDVSLIPTYEEIKAHKSAIDWVREHAKKKKLGITVELLRKLHEMVTPAEGPDDDRTHALRKENPLHRLYYHEIAQPDKIPVLLKKLADWLASDEFAMEHPVKRACEAHCRLLAIYPWLKNSGKVARLLMNLLLLHDGYLPVVIHSIERQRYYESLRNEHAGCAPLVMESLLNSADTALRFYQEVDLQRSKAAS